MQRGYRMPAPKGCPKHLYALMKQCWEQVPELRPGFTTLRTAFEQFASDVLHECRTLSGSEMPRNIGKLIADGRKQSEVSGSGGRGPARVYGEHEFPRDDLRYIRDLGEGEFGFVILMEVLGGDKLAEHALVAVKLLKTDALIPSAEKTAAAAAFQSEMDLMIDKDFQHPNVVCLIGVCSLEFPPYIILEYMDLGDLQNYLEAIKIKGGRPFSPRAIISIVHQVAAGAGYLASKDFVHRDLAARNILAGTSTTADDEISVKVGDFGLARGLQAEHQYYQMQSGGMMPLRWMAPEAILLGKYTEATDVWGFGVVMWEVVTYADQPYNNLSNVEVSDLIQTETLPKLVMPADAPEGLNNIMTKCFASDGHHRPTFSALEAELSDLLSIVDTPFDEESETFDGFGESSGTAAGPLRSGWLTKQGGGSSTFGRTNWKRRWCVSLVDYTRARKFRPFREYNVYWRN